jgi:segregation and condensation protein B
LLERGLIENAGRAEVIGRPMTYATTNLFLEYFGLRNLEELPAADELRRIPVVKPESLLTADGATPPANLATAPPAEAMHSTEPPAPEAAAPAAPTEPSTQPQ